MIEREVGRRAETLTGGASGAAPSRFSSRVSVEFHIIYIMRTSTMRLADRSSQFLQFVEHATQRQNKIVTSVEARIIASE